LVPDAQVEKASQTLSDLGLPLEPLNKHLVTTGGDFDSQGLCHRITRSTSTYMLQYLIIYPQSFATISDDELEELQPNHILSSRCKSVLVPTQPAIYAGIMRMMLRYPRFCSSMYTLRSDLSELIGYHMWRFHDGHVDPDEEDEWSADDAACIVRSWNLDRVWREGEEWMGDILVEVVRTFRMDHLPCKPNC
jgi:hypothetical protein